MKSRWMISIALLFTLSLLAACGGGGGGTSGGGGGGGAGSSDTTAPSIPTGLVATGFSTSQINLSWTASTDNVGVAGYNVYKNGAFLKTVTGTSVSDTLCSASTTYCYTVSAYDGAHNPSFQSTQACASTMSPSGWSAGIRIGDLRYFMDYNLYSPKVALNDNNEAIAVWDESSKTIPSIGQIWGNLYKNGSWGTPFSLSSPGAVDPGVAIDANGNGAALWSMATLTNSTIWASLYTAATNSWSTPVMISNPPGAPTTFFATNPQVAIDTLDNIFAVWEQVDSVVTQNSIWTSRYNGSAWSAPQLLSSGVLYAFDPQLAVDGNNNAFAVWTEDTSADQYPMPNVFARLYTAATATWGTSSTLIGKATFTTGAYDSTERPRLAVNANGDAAVAWEETHYNGSAFEYYIASAHYDKSLLSWQTPTNVTVDTTAPKYYPAVVIDGTGNVFAGWQQSSSPAQGWMSRYNVASKTWAVPARFESGTQAVSNIEIDVDGAGDALFVWVQGPLQTRWYMAASGWVAATSLTGGPTDLSLDVNGIGNAVIVSSQEPYNPPNTTSYGWYWAPYANHYIKP